MNLRARQFPQIAVASLVLVSACAVPLAAGPRRAKAKVAAAAVTAAALRERSLHLLDGSQVTLGSMQGQVVVVNFWASWCAPCRKELPALDALNTELARRGGRVVAVSIDEDPINVRRFAREHRLSLPIALDGPDGLARTLDLPHVPYTLVLDKSGAVAMTSAGSDPAALAALAARARELSDRAPVASHDPGDATP